MNALLVGFLWAIIVVTGFITFVKSMKRRGMSFGKNVVVRCTAGHLYTTIWIPGVSLKAVRWGSRRFQYCPVGKHWAMTRQVFGAELNPEVIQQAQQVHDVRIV